MHAAHTPQRKLEEPLSFHASQFHLIRHPSPLPKNPYKVVMRGTISAQEQDQETSWHCDTVEAFQASGIMSVE